MGRHFVFFMVFVEFIEEAELNGVLEFLAANQK